MGPDKDEDRRLAAKMLADLYLVGVLISLIINLVTMFKHGWEGFNSSSSIWLLLGYSFGYWTFKSRARQGKKSA